MTKDKRQKGVAVLLAVLALLAAPAWAGQTLRQMTVLTAAGKTPILKVSAVRRSADMIAATMQSEIASGSASSCLIQLEGRLDGIAKFEPIGNPFDCRPGGYIAVGSITFDELRANLMELTGDSPEVSIQIKIQTAD
jgi:hypothetical protein